MDSQELAWSKKGAGTVVQSTLRAVPATVPDPFLNHAQSVEGMRDDAKRRHEVADGFDECLRCVVCQT